MPKPADVDESLQDEREAVECNVCDGSGRYPIFTSGGKQLYTIRCPECLGDGKAYSEEDEIDPSEEREIERHSERLFAALAIIRANATAKGRAMQ